MSGYFKNLNKIEFVITDACTGKCKHCSEGFHKPCGEHIDPAVAANAVRSLSEEYILKTVMAFGGEPLLYPESVYAIISAAKELGIPVRQVITNGYFSKDVKKIREVAKRLYDCGVNDLLLSVDAFHQETIPLETVRLFAEECKKFGVPIRFQPAWLVSKADSNAYNLKTREILACLSDLRIDENDGNVIFPEGNAVKYLSEYFADVIPENPYKEDANDVRCISVSSNGDTLNGNLYRQDIKEIVRSYKPD
jgi:organic radical activating enzyme